MAHFIPTLRTATRPVYTTPAMRRKPDIPVPTRNPASGTDFGTILKNQPKPVATPAAAAPATPYSAIGSVTSSSTAASVAPATTSINPPAPTAQSLFGPNPWITTAAAGNFSYNPYYFATPATAAKVAQMLGGKVVAMNDITQFGPYQQNQPNQMILMPDGRLINAGLVAGFYDHGFSQQMVDKMTAAEVSGNTMFS